MKHLMIDLETLDTETSAHVLSIGACEFELGPSSDDPLRAGKQFYTRVHGDDQRTLGRTMGYGTVTWWMKQDEAARREAFEPQQSASLPRALTDLIDYFYRPQQDKGETAPTRVWANDPDFDISILRECAKACDMLALWPVRYNQGRSVRTVRDIVWPDGVPPALDADFRVGLTAHNALHDAIYQARLVAKGLKIIETGVAHLPFTVKE